MGKNLSFHQLYAIFKNFPIFLIFKPSKKNARRILINDFDMSNGNFDLKQSSKMSKILFLPDSHAMAGADQEYWNHSCFHQNNEMLRECESPYAVDTETGNETTN